MSSITFNSQHGSAFLSGAERALMGSLANSALMGALRPWAGKDEPLRRYITHVEYLRDVERFSEHFKNYLCTSGHLMVDGERIDGFVLAINTALVIGDDPMRLMARLHGQCELHGWIDGPNRAWIAGIIDQGLASGLYRRSCNGKPLGWEAVAEFLRERSDEPVVLSYSVTDSFPNHLMAGIDGDEDQIDQWDNLPLEERWRSAFAGLKALRDRREFRPDDWERYRFGHSLSGFDIRRMADEAADTTAKS